MCPDVSRLGSTMRAEGGLGAKNRGRAQSCSVALSAALVLFVGACRNESPQGSASSQVVDAGAAAVFIESGAPPRLMIVNQDPGRFVLRAGVPLQLTTKAILEYRGDDGRWTAYDNLDEGAGYRLLEHCPSAGSLVPSCLSLPADQGVEIEPWSGLGCAAQCGKPCPDDVFHSGAHRWVVTACDDPNTRYEGDSFTMPSGVAILARLRAVSSIARATIARLDPKGESDATTPSSPGRRAGFAVIAGTERPLGMDDRAEFARWMVNSQGFNDTVVRRCTRRHMVGVSLTRGVAPGRESTTEIALDFACNSIIIVQEQGGRRVATTSFFDATHATIVAIASRGLPSDKELAGLP